MLQVAAYHRLDLQQTGLPPQICQRLSGAAGTNDIER
jgi:hypothetical protein